MKNPFKRSSKISVAEIYGDEAVSIKDELASIKLDFCNALSQSFIQSFSSETNHFIVKFKVKKYGK